MAGTEVQPEVAINLSIDACESEPHSERKPTSAKGYRNAHAITLPALELPHGFWFIICD